MPSDSSWGNIGKVRARSYQIDGSRDKCAEQILDTRTRGKKRSEARRLAADAAHAIDGDNVDLIADVLHARHMTHGFLQKLLQIERG